MMSPTLQNINICQREIAFDCFSSLPILNFSFHNHFTFCFENSIMTFWKCFKSRLIGDNYFINIIF